jgi:hypothetical protein
MEYLPPYPGSYTSANPNLQHLRSSPSRFSPARQSPSRGNHTDSELLSSPSQVLYATISADKHNKNSLMRSNQHTAHSASQTVNSGFRPLTIDRQTRNRSGSKENILDEPATYRLIFFDNFQKLSYFTSYFVRTSVLLYDIRGTLYVLLHIIIVFIITKIIFFECLFIVV